MSTYDDVSTALQEILISSKIRIIPRQGTAAQWASVNPVLGSGEEGYETDTKKYKIGDGVKNWNDSTLPYNFSKVELDLGIVLASNPKYGTWPSTSGGDITANLDAAMTDAWDNYASRPGCVVIPSGDYVYNGLGYRGTGSQIFLAGVGGIGKSSCRITLGAGCLLINSVSQVTKLLATGIYLVNGWGGIRLAWKGNATAISYRVLDWEHTGYTGTAISSNQTNGQGWRIDARLVAAFTPADPGSASGTMGVAVNGYHDGSEMHVESENNRVGTKLGRCGTNGKFTTTHVFDGTSTRTWWNAHGWLVLNTRGAGSFFNSGKFTATKFGNEGMVPGVDYRYLAADQMGTINIAGTTGALFVETRTSATIPIGWTIDVVIPSAGNFQLVVKQGGVMQETSPVFTTRAQAVAWGTSGGGSTYLDITDTTNGSNANIPAAVANLPIGDFSSSMPSFSPSLGGSLVGLDIDSPAISCKGATGTVNSPLLTTTASPDNIFSVVINKARLLGSANWPDYLVKLIGLLTPLTTPGQNLVSATVVTSRTRNSAGNTALIPVCNVDGLFVQDSNSTVHRGTPTSSPLTAAGSANGATSSVAGDDCVMVLSLTTGTAGLANGQQASITFGQAYGVAPVVIANAQQLAGSGVYIQSQTKIGFIVCITSALAASTTYKWNISVTPAPS